MPESEKKTESEKLCEQIREKLLQKLLAVVQMDPLQQDHWIDHIDRAASVLNQLDPAARAGAYLGSYATLQAGDDAEPPQYDDGPGSP